MADLYAVGCAHCSVEIRDAPKMDGYLDALDYQIRYNHIPQGEPRPVAYLGGEYIEPRATVPGEDGWALIPHHNEQAAVHLCRCGAPEIEYDLWRGKVEIR